MDVGIVGFDEEKDDKGCLRRRGEDSLLLFSDPLPYFVESVRHDDPHPQEIVRSAETAGGKVALEGEPKLAFCACCCVGGLKGES